MQIDEDLVRKVAATARLRLSDEEVKKYVPQFEEILSLFASLAEVDTEHVRPSFIPIEKKNHLRDDEPVQCNKQKQMLALAEHTKDNYFKGPRAL